MQPYSQKFFRLDGYHMNNSKPANQVIGLDTSQAANRPAEGNKLISSWCCEYLPSGETHFRVCTSSSR